MTEKKPLNIEIGLRVKQYREAAGLTQEDFAELLGLGVKHVSAMECGAVGVSLVTLRQISRVLSISADAILFENEDINGKRDQNSEVQFIASRLSRLSPAKFKVVKEIVDKVLEALAME